MDSFKMGNLKGLDIVDPSTPLGSELWAETIEEARKMSLWVKVSPYGTVMIQRNSDSSWDVFVIADSNIICLHTAGDHSQEAIEVGIAGRQGFQIARKVIAYLLSIIRTFHQPFIASFQAAVPLWHEQITVKLN